MKSKWYEFYKERINSSYQDYFNERYKLMIDFILSFEPKVVVDAACGIGSISKALNRFYEKPLKRQGFDIDEEMVKLANKNMNSGHLHFKQGDIFDYKNATDELTVTHGVLEHFTDSQIKLILNRYPNSIHYVPLDAYHTPSFGDERLLPKDYWIETFKPSYYFTMNNEHDLVFKK